VVIKPPSDTLGLIVAEGRQYPFGLERLWHSAVAPSINQAIDMDLDGEGSIVAIRVVTGTAKTQESIEQATHLAIERGRGAADKALVGLLQLRQRMGVYPLVAACVLALAWFALTSISGISYDTSGLSFWDLSNLDMQSLAKLRLKERGVLNLIGLLCLAGPFVASFARKRLVRLAGALPLAFVAFTSVRIVANVRNYFATQATQERVAAMFGRQAPANYGEMEQTAIRTAMKGVTAAASLGSGFYLIVALSAYLAWRSWRAFAASSPGNP
jgi:hypothetical protein